MPRFFPCANLAAKKLGKNWKMSAAAVEKSDSTLMFCASCGVAGSDDIKLKKCTACYLVRYCSVKCQIDHRPKHKKECKKRAAELRDEILFKQPESNHFGDCPICCLPVPIDTQKSIFNSCCSKRICDGCNVANNRREIEARLQPKCVFCREPLPKTYDEADKRLIKRIEANDPDAIAHMGSIKYHEGDHKSAFECWTKAAALGDPFAHHELSILYREGQGVEKDEKRALYHAEQAAIGGHPIARHNVGWTEKERGRMDRAVKHYIIAAKLGNDKSLENLTNGYRAGHVSKEDFTAALRGYQAAIAATKSPQREEAAEYQEHATEQERRLGGRSVLTRR